MPWIADLQASKITVWKGFGGGGTLDWQTMALVVPREEGRGICDGCVDSYFSYNFLQPGFRLSG